MKRIKTEYPNSTPSVTFFNEATGTHGQIETFEKCPYFVIPAKAGIQKIPKRLDSRLRGNDSLGHMRRNSKVSDLP